MKFTVRNLAAWLVANTLLFFGFARKRTKKLLSTECITAIFFHDPSRKEFEYCIRWLKKRNFTFISVDDLKRLIENDIAFPKGGILLTVDDGWKSNEENIAELAEKYQVPVTIFIATEPVEEGTFWWSNIRKSKRGKGTSLSLNAVKNLPNEERLNIINEIKKSLLLEREALTVEQLRRISLSRYITIGAHTHSHPILINCDDGQVFQELKISRQKLEYWTGRKVQFFAYPNGDYGSREIDVLKKLDYGLAFASQPGYITEEIAQNKFALPRFGFLEGASKAENICRIIGLWKLNSLRVNRPAPVIDSNQTKYKKEGEVLADSQLSN